MLTPDLPTLAYISKRMFAYNEMTSTKRKSSATIPYRQIPTNKGGGYFQTKGALQTIA